MRRRGCGCFSTILMLVLIAAVVFFAREPLKRLVYPDDHLSYVQQKAAEYELDAWLIMAIIRTESNFDPAAQSAAGACGLMQLMPSTAEWLISKSGYDMQAEQAVWDAEQSITLGVWYLQWLYYSCYEQNMPAAVAAYNAGQSRVNEWLQNGTWDGSLEHAADIPYTETREYLEKVYRTRDVYFALYD